MIALKTAGIILIKIILIGILLTTGCGEERIEETTTTMKLGTATYVGQVKDDKPHGHGTAIWPNGSNYVGEWENGFFNGQGTLSLADGIRYEGEWEKGRYHGHGTMTYPDGQIKEGKWENNVFVGE